MNKTLGPWPGSDAELHWWAAGAIPASGLDVYRNGLLQEPGTDYVLVSNNVIQFTACQYSTTWRHFARESSFDHGDWIVPVPEPASALARNRMVGGFTFQVQWGGTTILQRTAGGGGCAGFGLC